MNRFLRICNQSVQKVLIRAKKCFLKKFNLGIKKRRISRWFQSVEKVVKLQSLQKVLIWPKKIKKGIKKRRIARWFRIRWKSCKKMHPKKVIRKNVTEICTFFTFTYVRQTCFACNFFLCIFLQLFQRIRNQHEILRFSISFFIFLGHIGTFCKLWS